MLYLVWFLTVVAAFGLGYHFRGVAKKIEQLEEQVKLKVSKAPEPIESQSTLIDPLDPVKEAMYEHEKMMKKLNP